MSDLYAIRADVLDTKSSITAPIEGAEAIAALLAQQLKTAALLNGEEYPARYVTAWTSGEEQFIQFARSYGSFVKYKMDKKSYSNALVLLRIQVMVKNRSHP
jgi:hypothetical protein